MTINKPPLRYRKETKAHRESQRRCSTATSRQANEAQRRDLNETEADPPRRHP